MAVTEEVESIKLVASILTTSDLTAVATFVTNIVVL